MVVNNKKDTLLDISLILLSVIVGVVSCFIFTKVEHFYVIFIGLITINSILFIVFRFNRLRNKENIINNVLIYILITATSTMSMWMAFVILYAISITGL